MRSLTYEAGDLSVMLAERIELVVAALHIDVRHTTRRALECFAPWDGHHKPKLIVELWPIPGKWNEWIGGKWGDAFDLVACVLGNGERDRKAAYQWSLEFLGLKRDRDPEWDRRRAEAQARAASRAQAAARELARMRKGALGHWLRAQPLKPGDDGWRYLEARGVDLGQLPRRPRAVRLAMREEWRSRAGEVQHVGPALASSMTLPDGEMGSLHRIWIDPARPGEKADLNPQRKMWPDASGCAIRLWRGESGLSEAEAAAKDLKETVVVCEGVEDGLSIALIAPELRIVAAGSLPGLTAWTPPACAGRVIVAADNDWGKSQAQALLDRACARLADEFSLPVAIARSPEGKDFNDLLRGPP